MNKNVFKKTGDKIMIFLSLPVESISDAYSEERNNSFFSID